MKNLLTILVAILLVSCSSKTVFVWTLKDILGLTFLGLTLLLIIICKVEDYLKKRKRLKKKQHEKETI